MSKQEIRNSVAVALVMCIFSYAFMYAFSYAIVNLGF
ncbi:Uncharacterised protein [Streptococcus pneumoniae]|nr:Uncharacterised protein [Streptococcus pneumoniae]CEV40772.1 Uncharacterised protein [Streptococcus pneumoniae]CEV84665.1 Uncharacterised protein [Streptococcus pneumoniae]CEY70523.1 Uncharacterised protein [Streptococcus pneumoniae]CGG49621.1 Uncharacterised protein [Streptococcus pneumoniae]